MPDIQRTRIKDLQSKKGEEVSITGWIDVRRDQGKLIFFDFRDETGTMQGVVLPGSAARDVGERVRPEWVVTVHGNVNERPEKNVQKEKDNGDIELEVLGMEVLSEAETPPFDISTDGTEINEEIRMQYRYLDLRRKRLQKNIRRRSSVNHFLRNTLVERGFTEIETPLLTRSTPEGARDYIVPSRIYPGSFYALPQSPQQYKQLLMVGGFERYFQLARCMRDEDTRGDRQPEFTQLDIECAFCSQEEILSLLEGMYTELVTKLYPEKRITQTPWPRLTYKEAMEKYGTDRPDIRRDVSDTDELGFVWIVDFPLFEEEKSQSGHFLPSHHMFTAPKKEDLSKLTERPEEVRSYQHDLALNGFEVAGGSIRIHNADVQSTIFDLIGFTEKQKQEFSHMLTAFRYGVPPHGGIASGLDRLLAVLENEPSIREVIAFPKTGEGRDLMMNTPSGIDAAQLTELGIEVKKKK